MINHVFLSSLAYSCGGGDIQYDILEMPISCTSPAVGWSQLAFLRSQGQTGCLCCDDGVMHIPDANRGIHVVEWRAVDPHLTRNVTLPGDDDEEAR